VLEIQNIKGKYRFVVKSTEGLPLLESVYFNQRKELDTCLDEIRPRLGNPACFERRTSHSGHFQFALKGHSGRVLGKSTLYRSEAGMENGIKNTLNSFLKGESS
jgi:uncharacterized protein YegP (UPF0339 family)